MSMAENAFVLSEALDALSRTPRVLDAMLRDLPDAWIDATEGGDTWSPRDIVGHLIHGEDTDWVPRARRILESGPSVPFDPFDRLAMRDRFTGWSMPRLLDHFAARRAANLSVVSDWNLDAAALARTGQHPALGVVTLRQLLATWVTHDFSHLGQIARVLAKRQRGEVGPWAQYLSILGTHGEP